MFEKRYNIKTSIKDYKYDQGPKDCVLEVYYHGDRIVSKSGRLDHVKIEKGRTLEFILSSKSGAPITIPRLICKKMGNARFILETYGIKIRKIHADGPIQDTSEAFIWKQIPNNYGGRLENEQKMELFITSEKPGICE